MKSGRFNLSVCRQGFDRPGEDVELSVSLAFSHKLRGKRVQKVLEDLANLIDHEHYDLDDPRNIYAKTCELLTEFFSIGDRMTMQLHRGTGAGEQNWSARWKSDNRRYY